MEQIAGHVLRKFRLERGLSQAAMGKKLGVDRMTAYRIEMTAAIAPKYLNKLSAVFGSKWFESIIDSKPSEELKLLRYLVSVVPDIELRLAELEAAQGIKHAPVRRSAIKHLAN